MQTATYKLIGRGVYSLPEAARLTKIPTGRIRRWMEGYSYVYRGKRRQSPPIVQSDIGRLSGSLALTFADLIEIRFLDRFLEYVSWQEIHIAAERARDLLNRSHPFSSRIFKTDGRHILAQIIEPGGESKLLNLAKNQWELERVVSPMLFAELEFNETDDATRWWPMGKTKSVLLDPARSFGAPITAEGGVRTSILAQSARVDGSQKMAAAIYEVPVRVVRHAVQYETRFLA